MNKFYSQFNQDAFLEKYVFKCYKNGFFMDVGANDGITGNNTLYFEENHYWKGVNFEPIKKAYDKLLITRPNCININSAVSNCNGTAEFLCNDGYPEILSGLKSNYDSRHLDRLNYENMVSQSTTETIIVDTKRIETICDEHNINHINYLSIDVEGAEFEVIKSINFEKVFIDVIGFENNYFIESIPIIKYLEDKGYRLLIQLLDIIMINEKSKFYTGINF